MDKNSQRTGEEIAEIYNRHVKTVYKVCFMLLRNATDAEDATQNTFFKMLRSGKTYQDEEHEKAWLIITAQNECKNILKHWWRKLKTSVDDIGALAAEDTGLHDDILEQVLSLPEKYRIPILLYYYEGYSTREIASILKIKDATIRSQLHTARNMLKIELGGEMNEGTGINSKSDKNRTK